MARGKQGAASARASETQAKPKAPKVPKVPKAPVTTSQRLGALIKSARDILRKDKGLDSDVDRLPTLTWLMLLKFLDDHEEERELEARARKARYVPIIASPYRWRDWVRGDAALTGDDLLEWLQRPADPTGKRAPGLFAYLRALRSGEGGHGAREVVAEVFEKIRIRNESGYLLRDVIQRVDQIHFDADEETQVLGNLYETMLREMRDAAGDAGEFYTPRPVVRFLVEMLDPKLHEVTLDPACGTGGFLVETYEHLRKQRKSADDEKRIQSGAIRGQEAKSLPYLLAQMNLLLHGLSAPQIVRTNSLQVKLHEISDAQRVDVILTNPPFGGEEERGIEKNFPAGMQTQETALLFVQLIMRMLRREPPGRAAVVVPNGLLTGAGIGMRVRKQLMEEFTLHTVLRLPNGTFAPYTLIPTNVLFFTRGGPTKEVWFYELPTPAGQKQYSKTKPLQFEEFAPVRAWWSAREENAQAWKVPAETIIAEEYNLDRRNPRGEAAAETVAPEELMARILEREHRILGMLEALRREILGGAGA